MRIFSGIQPTGRKHLGNYIGAIVQYVAGAVGGVVAAYALRRERPSPSGESRGATPAAGALPS